MKTDFYVFLPLVATVINAFVVWFLVSHEEHVGVHGQHHAPVDRHAGAGLLEATIELQRQFNDGGNDDSIVLESYDIQSSGFMDRYYDNAVEWKRNLTQALPHPQTVVVDEGSGSSSAAHVDPNLKKMAKYNDFEAYVRADISSYYQELPGSRVEVKPAYSGLAGKFVNMSPERMTLWWVDPQGKKFLNGDINPWGSGGTATFPGHTFVFTKYQKPNDVLCTFHVKAGFSVYFCDPFTKVTKDTYKHSLAGEVSETNVQSLESLSESDREIYKSHVLNLQFGDDYQDFTGGSPWLTLYPPNKLLHKIWPAEYFGQTHTVVTNETHFHSIPKLATSDRRHRKLTSEQMKNPPPSLAEYRQPGVLNLSIKALSCTPKAFEIRNFLSDAEVDHILGIVNRTHLERSTTNGHISSTRTSRTTWIGRDTDPIMNSIFRRVADVVRLDEAMLRQRHRGEVPDVQQLHKINEDLQIVHYDKDQQYTAHHDFGYPKGMQPTDKITRSMNLAMYLNDVDEGGETSFPRWRNAESFKSIDVKPEKGKALLFYMVNPDGNLEDMSQHAALPVIRGEKYFANLWMSTYQ